jgi:molybdate transport system substrate-binding protein
LAAQLLEGIDSDIFASANEGQMEILQNAGEIIGTATIFCTNSLTIGVPTENPYRITDLSDLTKPNIRLVLAAPNTPIREYSDLIVKKYLPPNDQISLYNNLVSEEPNVRQVVTKIALGEADAGIIYSSDITPDISMFVSAIPIPRENNIIARYPIAILNRTNHINLAEDFINFLVSDEGQEIFQKWGFGQKP